jgi:hypothetical protein
MRGPCPRAAASCASARAGPWVGVPPASGRRRPSRPSAAGSDQSRSGRSAQSASSDCTTGRKARRSTCAPTKPRSSQASTTQSASCSTKASAKAVSAPAQAAVQAADDAEVVEADPPVGHHEQVARVRIAMEQAVLEELRHVAVDEAARAGLAFGRGDGVDAHAAAEALNHHGRRAQAVDPRPGCRRPASRATHRQSAARSEPRARGPSRAAGCRRSRRRSPRGPKRRSGWEHGLRHSGNHAQDAHVGFDGLGGLGRRILTMTSVPSGSAARWICATEAAASGARSKRVKSCEQGRPNADSTASCACSDGNAPA